MTQPKEKGSGAGIKAVAEMLNQMDSESRKRILAGVTSRDPDIAKEIENQMFTFESLIRLDGHDIQILIREIPMDKLAIALRNVSEAFKEFLYKNISKRAQKLLQEEIDAQGPRRLSEIQEVQREILGIFTRLESEGKIRRP